MDARTDGELLRDFVGTGDEQALAGLVLRHGQMVNRVCRRILGDASAAEDAAQATFVVLVRKAASFRGDRNLSAWLYGVARRVALDALRSRQTRIRREEDSARWAQEEQDSEAVMDNEIVLGNLDAALADLPGKQREAVVLLYLQGLSQNEAAGMVGCPRGTLARRASDGLARLRRRLMRYAPGITAAGLVGLLEAEAHAAMPAGFASSVTATCQLALAGTAMGTASAAFGLADRAIRGMFLAKVKAACIVAALTAAAIMLALVGTRPTWMDAPARTERLGGEERALHPESVPGRGESPETAIVFEDDFENGLGNWEAVMWEFVDGNLKARPLKETERDCVRIEEVTRGGGRSKVVVLDGTGLKSDGMFPGIMLRKELGKRPDSFLQQYDLRVTAGGRYNLIGAGWRYEFPKDDMNRWMKEDVTYGRKVDGAETTIYSLDGREIGREICAKLWPTVVMSLYGCREVIVRVDDFSIRRIAGE